MRVLLVEDNDGDADLVKDALTGAVTADIELARVDRLAAASERLDRERFDVVLLDLSLPDANGLDGLDRIRAAAPRATIVVLTGLRDEAVGTKAIQRGAQDFLHKDDVHGTAMLRAIRYARERAQYSARTQLLSDVGIAVGGSFDPDVMIASFCACLKKEFTDWCGVESPPTSVMPEPTRTPLPIAARTARLFTTLANLESDDPERARVDDLIGRGYSSAMVVPFHGNGWPDGTMTLARTSSERAYGPADLALAEELTRRAAQAIDYALLLGVAERARDRAEVAGRMRDEFLATLSHELRTPLNAILGWTQMLRSGLVPEAKWPSALETIERNAKSQVALIEDVLDVSRIITGKIRLKVNAVDLAATIASAIDTVRPAADAKGVTIDVVSAPEMGIVQGDADRLLQILWNLLANAVKFTPRGGNVVVRMQRDKSSIEISVADTGNGIAAEHLPHIFERFRQGDSSITRRHGGLGLGLAIARHLVELQGGAISATSDGVGLGSTFRLRLPVAVLVTSGADDATHTRPPPHETVIASHSLAGLVVLVVDDDDDARMMLQSLLEASGAAVAAVDSVREALTAFGNHRPHILISDIGMPGESGFDLIAAIRKLSDADGGTVPAVALSAYARTEDREKALSGGFDQYVTKPVSAAELIAVLISLRRRLANA